MKINDTFTFGKYKGQTLKTVLAEHGSYVGWCMENVSGFDIEPEDLKHRFIQEYNQWKHRIETRNLTPFQRGWETALREDWEECDTRPW